MDFEEVSAEGVALIQHIREVANKVTDLSRSFIKGGQTLTPVYMFLVKDGDRMENLMFPCAQLPTKDHVGAAIRSIAANLKVIAVIHITEAYSLWRPLTIDDVREITEKYDGRVSKHPEARDVAMFNVTCNVRGNLESLSKMLLIDESVKPRRILEEKDWDRYSGKDSRMEGRMVVPHELLVPIE